MSTVVTEAFFVLPVPVSSTVVNSSGSCVALLLHAYFSLKFSSFMAIPVFTVNVTVCANLGVGSLAGSAVISAVFESFSSSPI